MFDCWTEKHWKIIRTSEDLTVGIPIQLVNPAGSLVEWEYKRQYLPIKINLYDPQKMYVQAKEKESLKKLKNYLVFSKS